MPITMGKGAVAKIASKTGQSDDRPLHDIMRGTQSEQPPISSHQSVKANKEWQEKSKAAIAETAAITQALYNRDHLHHHNREGCRGGRDHSELMMSPVASANISRSQSADLSRGTPSYRMTLMEELKFLNNQGLDRNRHERFLNRMVGFAIVINAIIMGFELDYGPKDDASLEERAPWIVVECMFILLFVFELVMRIYWERKEWFRSLWNWLDFFVILVASGEMFFLALADSSTSRLSMALLLRIIRLVRLVRVIKLVRTFHGFYVTVMAFRDAMGSMLHIGGLLVAGLYLCSIFTTSTIGRSQRLRQLQMGNANGEERFGSIPNSMYSLFELMTLEGWEMVGRPIVMEEPAMAIFLFAFILVFTFGLLNMIIAMVVEKTLMHSRKMEEYEEDEVKDEVKYELCMMQQFFLEADSDKTGMITRQQFQSQMAEKDSEFAKSLERTGIGPEDANTLFNVLDVDLTGSITFEELLAGCAKIRGCSGSMEWDLLTMQATLKTVSKQVNRLHSEFRRVFAPQRPGCNRDSTASLSIMSGENTEKTISSIVSSPVSLPDHCAVSTPQLEVPQLEALPGALPGQVKCRSPISAMPDPLSPRSPSMLPRAAVSSQSMLSIGSMNSAASPAFQAMSSSSTAPGPTWSSTEDLVASQMAFERALFERWEADRATRDAQHALMVRLEDQLSNQAALNAKILARLDSAAAQQDEIRQRLWQSEGINADDTRTSEVKESRHHSH